MSIQAFSRTVKIAVPNDNFNVIVQPRIRPVVQHQLFMRGLPDIRSQTTPSYVVGMGYFVHIDTSAFLPRLLPAKSFTMVYKTPGCHIFPKARLSDGTCLSLPRSSRDQRWADD
jgi:hypothetical protein